MDESTHGTTNRTHDPTPDAPRAAPSSGRVRRALPWIIAAVAALAAAIAIALLLVDRSSEPRPVAQLAAQPDAEETIPLDEENEETIDVSEDDFVLHGSYGVLQLWSTTLPDERRCIAVVAEEHISMFHCSAPTVDTVTDFNIDPQLVPPAPTGERTSLIHFVLHDDVVDVYLAPKPGGGYY